MFFKYFPTKPDRWRASLLRPGAVQGDASSEDTIRCDTAVNTGTEQFPSAVCNPLNLMWTDQSAQIQINVFMLFVYKMYKYL